VFAVSHSESGERLANASNLRQNFASQQLIWHVRSKRLKPQAVPWQLLFGREARMSHDHDHSGQDIPSDPALRVKALESLLVEKGLVDSAAIDAWVDLYETKVGPHNGARVVARAWVDPEFKRRLLADATPVLDEMGLLGRQGHDVVVVENTVDKHNLVVCTLC
jgi:hypothetical protein